jgi:hypothetical protein
MVRGPKDLLSRRQFDEITRVHHSYTVRNVRDHRKIVRNEQHGEAEFLAQFS